jgi:DNA-binding response OmpR family regulator
LRGTKDGVQACEEIRRQVDVPIVYVTAHSDEQTVSRAKRTDHDGFILKPFHRHELQSTIEVALQRHAIRTKGKTQ